MEEATAMMAKDMETPGGDNLEDPEVSIHETAGASDDHEHAIFGGVRPSIVANVFSNVNSFPTFQMTPMGSGASLSPKSSKSPSSMSHARSMSPIEEEVGRQDTAHSTR